MLSKYTKLNTPAQKPCKTCGTTDPSQFYETQASLYCKTHHKERYFQKGRQRLLIAKLQRGACADCRLAVTDLNHTVFDFDHLRDKKYQMSKMTSCSNESFESELVKCELVCSNCHRIRTKRRGVQWRTPGRPRSAVGNDEHLA